MKFDFGRVLTAMVTPFHQDGSVNYDGARKLARHLADHGNDGIVVCGTTGESPTLTKEEKVKLFEVVASEVGNRVKVVAGTGSNNTADSIALTQAAEKAGVHGVMLVGPYYNKPQQEGYFRHFAEVAGKTKLPVMLYNVPSRTGSNIAPETVVRLSEIDNIVAIKEAAGSMDQTTELIRSLPDGFLVYSGDDSLTLPMLSLGGHGIVSVAAHFIGDEIQAMVQAFIKGDVKEAARLHAKLFPVFKGIFCTTNPVPVKACMNILGHGVGPVRLPLVDATEREMEFLRGMLKEQGLLEEQAI